MAGRWRGMQGAHCWGLGAHQREPSVPVLMKTGLLSRRPKAVVRSAYLRQGASRAGREAVSGGRKEISAALAPAHSRRCTVRLPHRCSSSGVGSSTGAATPNPAAVRFLQWEHGAARKWWEGEPLAAVARAP